MSFTGYVQEPFPPSYVPYPKEPPAPAPKVPSNENGDRYSPSKESSPSASDDESSGVYPPGEDAIDKNNSSRRAGPKPAVLDRNQAKKRLLAFSVAKSASANLRNRAFQDDEPDPRPPKATAAAPSAPTVPAPVQEKREKSPGPSPVLKSREPQKSMIESIMEEEMLQKAQKAKLVTTQATAIREISRRSGFRQPTPTRERSRRSTPEKPPKEQTPEPKRLKELPKSWEEMKTLGVNCEDVLVFRKRQEREQDGKARDSSEGRGSEKKPVEKHSRELYFRGYELKKNLPANEFPTVDALKFEPALVDTGHGSRPVKRSHLRYTRTEPHITYAETRQKAVVPVGEAIFDGNSVEVNRFMRMVTEGVGLEEKGPVDNEPSFRWFLEKRDEMACSAFGTKLVYDQRQIFNPSFMSKFDAASVSPQETGPPPVVSLVKSRWDSDNEEPVRKAEPAEVVKPQRAALVPG